MNHPKQSECQIIELAISEVELLTKAFTLIAQWCEQKEECCSLLDLSSEDDHIH